MTDDIEKASVKELMLAREGQSVDWYLQTLVSITNTQGMEFGITLLVEGIIVSGILIGGKKYFETFAEEFADAYPGDAETKEMFRDAIASAAGIYERKENGEDVTPPQFIHLANARCFSPDGKLLPTNRGILWRGKINAVSGFILGTLSTG